MAQIPDSLRCPPTSSELDDAGVRMLKPSRRPGWLASTLRSPLNAAFDQLPYYTPISRAQMSAQTGGAELLMDPALVIIAADNDQHPGALSPGRGSQVRSFVLVLPDPADTLRASDGRLGLRSIWELLRGKLQRGGAAEKTAVLIVQGTVPAHQGSGLLSLCIRQLYAQLHARGYCTLRVTFIAEDNPGSAAVFARAGGYRLHGLSFFTAPLGQEQL